MRCQQCGYPNPEDHKFCGMCGTKVQTSSSVAIDDNDPLGLEASSYRFGDRSSALPQDQSAIWERDQRRESIRDAARTSDRRNRVRTTSVAALQNLPPDTAQEEIEQELRRERPASAGSIGISGPSFLGLGSENEGSAGFVYDSPKDDGFIYDTDNSAPEYLLTEVSRGVSWRAWALFALLLVAAGLGYVQWRASHHQGPDIAAILAGNGATLDATAPVVDNKNPKPAPKTNTPASDAAKPDGDKSSDNATASDAKDAKDAKASSSDESTEQKTPTGKSAAKKDGDEGSNPEATKEASVAKSRIEDAEEAAKPESDGPVAKATKSNRTKSAPIEEEPAQPKSLGDKDPLVIQAEKYIQGRGVRQNCSTGVNLLRQASSAGNPTADVKMGALYWSGTCVTQSNVTAYQWFSRAHSLEPRNRWIERSRSSLWSNMNADEKRRVSY